MEKIFDLFSSGRLFHRQPDGAVGSVETGHGHEPEEVAADRTEAGDGADQPADPAAL